MDRSECLLEDYYEDVLRFLRGLSRDEHLAEELTQETIYRAIKSIHTFQGNSDMRIWLCSIAKNVFYSYCKKHKKTTYGETYENYEAEEKLLEQMVEDKEMAFHIHQILHELKEPYKEIFSLRIFGELSFKEIASLFQKSEHWACVTYYRAKLMIRQKLEDGKENL